MGRPPLSNLARYHGTSVAVRSLVIYVHLNL